MIIRVTQAIAFGVAVAPIIITPGAGFSMFATTMVTRGPRGARPLVGGLLAGMLVMASALAVFYPMLAGRQGSVRNVVAVVGGVYLIAMGSRDLWRVLARGRAATLIPDDGAGGAGIEEDAKARFTEGAITSLTNPGLFIIYLVVVPAFISATATPRAEFAVLAAQHMAMAATWYGVLLVAFGAARRFIASPRRQAAIVVCASLALVWIGVTSIASALQA